MFGDSHNKHFQNGDSVLGKGVCVPRQGGSASPRERGWVGGLEADSVCLNTSIPDCAGEVGEEGNRT